jgi:hypothetical protein
VGTYGLGIVCFGEDRKLASWSAAWVAFNPKFAFVSGAVSNDSGAGGLAALVLWITAVWVVRGPSVRRAVAWGIALGLAALTKVSVLGVIPICVVGFYLGVRGNSPRRTRRYATWIAGLTLLVAGWWYVRGAVLYGDPLGLSTHLQAPWARQRPTAFLKQLPGVPDIERTYWAAFGWSNIHLPEWLYRVVLEWEHIGLFGVGLYVWRSWRALGRRRWLIVLLLAWLLLCLMAHLWWMRTMGFVEGRLMFPAAAALGVLLLMGWQGWLPSRWQRIGLGAMTAGLLAFAVASPLAFIRPAFARPPQLSAARLAALKEWPQVVFDGRARLLAAEVSPQPVHPGEWTWVKLCWESLAPLEEDYEVFVHFLGLADRIVAARHTHAGLGAFPTSAWQPGDAFCDTIRLRVEESAPAPAVYDVEVGLYHSERDERLQARDEHDHVLAPVFVGRAKVWAAEPPTVAPPHPTDYLLGDQIALLGYDLRPGKVRAGEALTLTLYWRAERRPETDYTVFVHLLDEAGNLVAQADGPPQGGVYPTSWWEAGDEVEDVRQVALPADVKEDIHSLVVGLYRWETMERLPVHAADGTPAPDAAIRLTEVPVVHQ